MKECKLILAVTCSQFPLLFYFTFKIVHYKIDHVRLIGKV